MGPNNILVIMWGLRLSNYDPVTPAYCCHEVLGCSLWCQSKVKRDLSAVKYLEQGILIGHCLGAPGPKKVGRA